MAILLFSTQPSSRSPPRNAASRGEFRDRALPGHRYPIWLSFFVCCASAGWTKTRAKVTSANAICLNACPNCDYKRTNGSNAVVEPRDSVKGEIARTLVYMHVEYELPVNGMLPMLKRLNAPIRRISVTDAATKQSSYFRVYATGY